MGYSIELAATRRQRRTFVDVPRLVMASMPAFVPPLTADELGRIDPRRNPFFEHAESTFWILRDGKRAVGRISATVDQLALDYAKDQTGVFGHFLAPDAPGAALLLDAAAEFLRAHGLAAMRGPIELSTNHTCGLQVSGFDLPPRIQMNQHPPGQEDLLLAYGLEPCKDLLAFECNRFAADQERLARGRRIATRRAKVQIRNLDLRNFANEVDRLHTVYQRSWAKNFAFAPMSHAEFAHAAKDFRRIACAELCQIAERDGEPVGFILGLPDVNVGIRACNGRLWPFGFVKLLRAVRKTDRFRVVTLGIVPELRGKGVDSLLILEHIERGTGSGYHDCEMSWVLADNVGMVKPLVAMGARESARYRLYEAALRAPTIRRESPLHRSQTQPGSHAG